MRSEAPTDEVRQRRVGWRLGICASALAAGVLSASLPVFQGFYGPQSLVWATIDVASQFAHAFDGPRTTVSDVMRLQTFVTALWAFVLAQPVLIYQGLAMAGPPDLSKSVRGKAATSLCAAFVLGVVVAFVLAVPLLITWMADTGERSGDLNIGDSVFWNWYEMAWTVPRLYVLVGLAFQLPLWPGMLIHLRIVPYGVPARFRRWVLLATVIVAALATPTSDITTMAMVAAPLYLLYETGLLAACSLPAQKDQGIRSLRQGSA